MLFLVISIGYSQININKVVNKFDWNNTTLDIEVPADFELSNYKTIILAEVLNSLNETDQHTSDIYDELSSAIIASGQIELVDRKKTELLLNEFEFQASGLVNDATMKNLGEFAGSGLLVVCRLQKDEYSEKLKSFKIPLVDILDDCKSSKSRLGTHLFKLNIKLIDLESAKIIYSKTIDATQSEETDKYNCLDPPDIDTHNLYASCLESLKEQYTNIFRPHVLNQTVKFQKDSKFNEQLKLAITNFDLGEFKEGYTILETISESHEKSKVKSAALYNLGLIQYLSKDYENCIQTIKKAYLLNSNNKDCLAIINALK